jgi:hypothetical protein
MEKMSNQDYYLQPAFAFTLQTRTIAPNRPNMELVRDDAYDDEDKENFANFGQGIGKAVRSGPAPRPLAESFASFDAGIAKNIRAGSSPRQPREMYSPGNLYTRQLVAEQMTVNRLVAKQKRNDSGISE